MTVSFANAAPLVSHCCLCFPVACFGFGVGFNAKEAKELERLCYGIRTEHQPDGSVGLFVNRVSELAAMFMVNASNNYRASCRDRQQQGYSAPLLMHPFGAGKTALVRNYLPRLSQPEVKSAIEKAIEEEPDENMRANFRQQLHQLTASGSPKPVFVYMEAPSVNASPISQTVMISSVIATIRSALEKCLPDEEREVARLEPEPTL